MVGKVVRGGMQQSNGYGKAQDLPNGSLRQEKIVLYHFSKTSFGYNMTGQKLR